MPHVTWTPAALDDVQRRYRFLAVKNARAATAIRDGTKTLGTYAQAGRPIDGMEVAFREWPIDLGDSGYVMLYRLSHDEVVILAVRHQKEAGY